MDRVKFLKWAVVALIALNLMTLVFGFRPRMGRPNSKGIQQHFNFSESQMQEFEKSRMKIISKLDVLNPTLQEISKKYYLTKEENDTTELMLEEIELINKQIYKAHHRHFAEVAAICNEEQILKLDEFINQLMRRDKRRPRR